MSNLIQLSQVPDLLNFNLAKHLDTRDMLSVKQTCSALNSAFADSKPSVHLCCAKCHTIFVNVLEDHKGLFFDSDTRGIDPDLVIVGKSANEKDWKQGTFEGWVLSTFSINFRRRRSRTCRVIKRHDRGTFHGYGALDVRLHIPLKCKECDANIGHLLVDDGKRFRHMKAGRMKSAVQFREFAVSYFDHNGVECGPNGRALKSNRGTEYKWAKVENKFTCVWVKRGENNKSNGSNEWKLDELKSQEV